MPSAQGLVRLAVRNVEGLDELLGLVALRGEDTRWRDWAREQAARRGR